MSPTSHDPNQLGFDFEAKIEEFTELGQEILEYRRPTIKPDAPCESFDSVAEFHIEVAAMLKGAIRDAGLSREEVLDRYNKYWGATDADDAHRPMSIHVLNNHLSKPAENPPPMRLVWGIVAVTQHADIPMMFAHLIHHKLISLRQFMLMRLGEIHEISARVSAKKRQLISEFRCRGVGNELD